MVTEEQQVSSEMKLGWEGGRGGGELLPRLLWNVLCGGRGGGLVERTDESVEERRHYDTFVGTKIILMLSGWEEEEE